MRYYLIAGEASGDLHASNLMQALKTCDHAADFRFYGGDKMETVGGTMVKHYREMSYMGFVPVLLHARTILRTMHNCKADILAWKPDVVILVDYPGFNLSVAKYVKEHTDIPVFYYISPKIWAWKEYRIKSIRKYVDELFSILPFEVEFFEQKHHYPIHYVGNPCVDAIDTYHNAPGYKKPAKESIIAVLAGSRRQEIRKNLDKMLKAASTFDGYRCVIAGAPNIPLDIYKKYMPAGMDTEVVYDRTYDTLERADAALVTSGTATLETALLDIPQVVCYYFSASWFINILRRLLLKVKFISLVNLICRREAVRELTGSDMSVEKVQQELAAILPGGRCREEMLRDYANLRRIIGPAGASGRAAKKITEILHRKP